MTCAVMTWPNVPCAKLPHVFLKLSLPCDMEPMHGHSMAGTKLIWT